MSVDLFPPGFWPGVAMLGMIIFIVFGVDLLFGAKFMFFASRIVNKKIRIDDIVIHALQELKKTSDREFDMERSLLHGWGRFVVSGLLFFGAALILFSILPKIH